jgi:hypothetical protein
MRGSTQSLASTNLDTPSTTSNLTTFGSKINDRFNNTPKRQSASSAQQLPPKMGLKALNHTPANKVTITFYIKLL